MIRALLFFFLASTMPLFAASIRLINDSPYPLRVVIRGNDGSFLGEMTLNSQHASTWSGTNAQMGYYGKGNAYQEQPNRAQTPYTVLWYCTEGSDYSVCNGISTGSTVTALNCLGTRQCKPKQKTPSSPKERQGFLENEEKREESTVGPPSY